MKLRDYLINVSTEELTERLIYLDKALSELHHGGYYVTCDFAEIEVYDDEITLASFKNKIDYINSGIEPNGVNRNILELCSIGICAYNKLSVLHTSREFISYVIENVEMFLEHGNIPSMMQEYYIEVFNRGNVIYLNVFLINHQEFQKGNNQNNISSLANYKSKVLGKSTAIGRALSDKENAAFASVLIIPALLALIYIIAVVGYFIFFK